MIKKSTTYDFKKKLRNIALQTSEFLEITYTYAFAINHYLGMAISLFCKYIYFVDYALYCIILITFVQYVYFIFLI